MYKRQGDKLYAEVWQNDTLIERVQLTDATDRTIKLDGNTIVLSGKTAKMADADCRDQVLSLIHIYPQKGEAPRERCLFRFRGIRRPGECEPRRRFFRHRLSGVLELPQACSPLTGGKFFAEPQRGVRLPGGGTRG